MCTLRRAFWRFIILLWAVLKALGDVHRSCSAAKDPAQCEAKVRSFQQAYPRELEKTLEISRRQAKTGLYRAQWRIEGCSINPSLHEWIFPPWKGATSPGEATSRPLLMTWCGQGRYGFRFIVVQRFVNGWRRVKESDVVERLSPHRQPANAEGFYFSDPRLVAESFEDPKTPATRLL